MARTPESDFYNGMHFVAATDTGDRARGAYREDDITVFGVVQGESGVVGLSRFSPPLQRAQRWATRALVGKCFHCEDTFSVVISSDYHP